MSSAKITNPDLPLWNAISGGLRVGKVIQIQGVFPQVFDVSEYSEISLCEKSPETIALHISIRFDNRQVIRNTFERNKWKQGEEEGSFPFQEGRQFFVEIVVHSRGYQILVNGQQCWTYSHRLPYTAVTHLNIDGPLIIWNVEYTSNDLAETENLYFPPVQPATLNLDNNPAETDNLHFPPVPPATVRLDNNKAEMENLHFPPVPPETMRLDNNRAEMENLRFPPVPPAAMRLDNNRAEKENLRFPPVPPAAMRLDNNRAEMENLRFPTVPPTTTRLHNNPSLPYWGDLPERLAMGSIVAIQGSFPRFIDGWQCTEINLCQNSVRTIAFHLSIRFDHNVAIRNTYRLGRWETEETGGPFPFALGNKFLMKIVVQLRDYQISVNGTHCWSFQHRLPFGMVDGLSIDGPVHIQHIDYTSTMEQQQIPEKQLTYLHAPPDPRPQQQPTYVHAPPDRRPLQQEPTYVHTPPDTRPPRQQKNYMHVPPDPSSQQAPSSLHNVYNPVVPFSYHINGGIRPNMMICISGIPFPEFQKFTISLECGQQEAWADVAFQFDVRGYSGTVVRNTRHNNSWEDEETAAPSFPFYPDVPFDIAILIQNDKYRVSVNDTYFIQYYHRMSRFSKINVLKIENDVRITCVRLS